MPSLISAGFVALLLLASLIGCGSRPQGDRLPDVGQPVPSFDLPALDGSRVTSASITGAPALIALWSSDCGASQLAIRALDAIHREYTARGVRVLVLADDGDPQVLRAALDRAKVTLPVAYASGTLDDIFDADRHVWQHTFALPSFLIVDERGHVATKDWGVAVEEVEKKAVRLQSVRSSLDRLLAARGERAPLHPRPPSR